jgi:hypothetical protein
MQQVRQAKIVLKFLKFGATSRRDFQPLHRKYARISEVLECLHGWEYRHVALLLALLFNFGSFLRQIHLRSYLNFRLCHFFLNHAFLEQRHPFAINSFVVLLVA